MKLAKLRSEESGPPKFAAKILEKKHILKMKKEKYAMTEREVCVLLCVFFFCGI